MVDLTYTQQTIAADVIPNAIGGIASYCEHKLSLGALFGYLSTLRNSVSR